LAALEADAPAWGGAGSAPVKDPQTVAQTFTRILGEVNLPTAALSSLSPESVTTIGGANLPEASRPRRVRHTAVLEPITLPQLGRVLERWGTARPDWTVLTIEIAPLKVEPGAKSARKGAPLRVTLTVETVRAGSCVTAQ
jgi:hypothetical protein